MIDYIFSTLGMIHPKIFLVSILVFFVGYALAPTAYFKNIRILTVYPMWLSGKLEEWSKKKWNPYLLFLFLISMNSLSLFISLLSGYFIALPFIFAAWTGLNIGVVTYHTLKGQLYYAALLNPVAMFELPAAFITFTLAFQYNFFQMGISIKGLTETGFIHYIMIFITLVIPLLIIAGIFETVLIIYSRKFEEKKDDNHE